MSSDFSNQIAGVTDELLNHSIPCRCCGRPAQLRSFAHHCPKTEWKIPAHACIKCWQEWLTETLEVLAEYKHIRCECCGQQFPTIEAFSDYREF